MTAVRIIALFLLFIAPLIGFFSFAGALSLTLRWLRVPGIRFRSVLWIAFRIMVIGLVLAFVLFETGLKALWWQIPLEAISFGLFFYILRRYKPITAIRAFGIFVLSNILGFVGAAVLAVIFVVPIRYFVASPFQLNGESMLPAYRPGDLVLIDKLSLRSHAPERGDVVVLIPPIEPSQYFAKRVIGLPGDEVQIANGQVMIFNREHPDGYALPEPYLFKQSVTEGVIPTRVSVAADSYFVLGDNREHSNDSRYWGTVPATNLVGIVALRIWPPA